ncbi:MAG: hypothetical protein JO069_03230 [Verrucomicrobia bacterium]|nr:hypothetical protein [Verrucomicrobiota bacterium]
MKALSFGCVCVCALVVCTASLSLAKDTKDTLPVIKAPEYSLATGEPYPSEVDLAYRRFWKFLQHPNARARQSLKQTPIIAVQVGEFQASEVPIAISHLLKGTARATTYYGSDPTEPAVARLKFLILFDSRDRRFVGPVGFFVNDTPNRGEIGNFGGIAAVYGGMG